MSNPLHSPKGEALESPPFGGIEGGLLPAEWHPQSFIQLTWPHAGTDWAYMLDEVEECFARIATEIAAREPLLIVAPQPEEVRRQLAGRADMANIRFFACDTNDTWARDHAFLTLLTEQGPLLMDFCFNGWGLKFAADKDNRINRRLYASGLLQGRYVNGKDFVLEGGSVESDGRGTLLTTSSCLLAPNRNDTCGRAEIEARLKRLFCLKQVLWIEDGGLAGDDTDGHVDTLARLCPDDTIVYVQCRDREDEHYAPLCRMEEQLAAFRTPEGHPFRLLPLPLPAAIYDEGGERLPATYANFLVMNGAVLCPTYGQPALDAEALRVIGEAFPGRETVGIDCRPLIRQHGSLHCVTMQYPAPLIQGNSPFGEVEGVLFNRL